MKKLSLIICLMFTSCGLFATDMKPLAPPITNPTIAPLTPAQITAALAHPSDDYALAAQALLQLRDAANYVSINGRTWTFKPAADVEKNTQALNNVIANLTSTIATAVDDFKGPLAIPALDYLTMLSLATDQVSGNTALFKYLAPLSSSVEPLVQAFTTYQEAITTTATTLYPSLPIPKPPLSRILSSLIPVDLSSSPSLSKVQLHLHGDTTARSSNYFHFDAEQ